MKIKNGIDLHLIETNKFKTNLISIILTTKLERNTVTKNALIPTILKRGTKNIKSQEEISKKLEEMYGAYLDCGIEKLGDNHVLKFYIETLNDNFLPQKEDLLKESIKLITDFVFNPYTENEAFKKEYIDQEKENLKQIIDGKADNKARYASYRCLEEMYKNEPYGLYRYGYTEDLENIDEKNLYEYYKKLINECKIDIFVSGLIDQNTENLIKENENISKLQERNPQYNKIEMIAKKSEKENVVKESKEVTQGKIVIGLDIDENSENAKYAITLYNAILGGSANSKLFQNVREKASLAYYASSSYNRTKNNLFINSGIEIKNYDKAIEIIKKQIEDMKKGDFTENDIKEAKKIISSSLKTVDDEQDLQINFEYTHEICNEELDLNKYISNMEKVTKEEIVDIANKISINTIYFLKD